MKFCKSDFYNILNITGKKKLKFWSGGKKIFRELKHDEKI